MSLNKFPSTANGEDVGYDLKLNIGADTIKCNNLEVLNAPYVEYEQQNPPRDKPTAEGRLALYKTDNVDGSPITSSNVIRVVPTADAGGNGESLELGSSQMRTTNRVDCSVVMEQTGYGEIPVGTTNTNLSAQFDNQKGSLSISTDINTTQVNCNSIRLLPEYQAQSGSWVYTFAVIGTRLSLTSGFVANLNFYPLLTPASPAPYVITPPVNGMSIVKCYWLPASQAWFCQEITA